MANDYYDFNPSPAVWALLLTGMVLFVLAISALLIVQVANGEATGPIVREVEPMAGDLLEAEPGALRVGDHPAAKAS